MKDALRRGCNRLGASIFGICGAVLWILVFSNNILGHGDWQWQCMALLLVLVWGLVRPNSRERTLSHAFALSLSFGSSLVVAVLGYLLMLESGSITWVWESLVTAVAGFVWMNSGLSVNRKWVESGPLLLGFGAFCGWDLIQDMQSFRCPISGLFEFFCAIGGGWLGWWRHCDWRGKRGLRIAYPALAIGVLAAVYTLVLMPPGSPQRIYLHTGAEEVAYLCYANGSEDSNMYVLRLGFPSNESVDVLYNTWMSDDYATLIQAHDPDTIDKAYLCLAAQDEQRYKTALADGSIPPFMSYLWKLRMVPRRGSIWVANPIWN